MLQVAILARADPVVVAGVLLGAVLGLHLGNKARALDPQAPMLLSAIGGIAGGALAYTVLDALLLLLLLIGIPAGLWYFGRHVRDWSLVFASAAGACVKGWSDRRSHRQKIAAIEAEHRDRLQAIYDADIPADSLAKLLDQEDRRFDQELQNIDREA